MNRATYTTLRTIAAAAFVGFGLLATSGVVRGAASGDTAALDTATVGSCAVVAGLKAPRADRVILPLMNEAHHAAAAHAAITCTARPASEDPATGAAVLAKSDAA